jgi:hypothetical protein
MQKCFWYAGSCIIPYFQQLTVWDQFIEARHAQTWQPRTTWAPDIEEDILRGCWWSIHQYMCMVTYHTCESINTLAYSAQETVLSLPPTMCAGCKPQWPPQKANILSVVPQVFFRGAQFYKWCAVYRWSNLHVWWCCKQPQHASMGRRKSTCHNCSCPPGWISRDACGSIMMVHLHTSAW